MEQAESPHIEERVLSAIGYAGVLFLIPLFLKKDSHYCQFHGKQGFVLFMAWIVNTMIAIIPILGWLIAFFGSIFLIVITLMAIFKAINGEQWVLPLIGEYAENLHV